MDKKLVVIRDYHLKSEDLQKRYEQHCAKASDSIKEWLNFMDATFFLASWVLETPVTKNKHFRDVLHLLLSRALKNYRSIRVLLPEGLEQDGFALLRNLLETAMTIKYIAADETGALAERFRKYQDVERYKHMQKNQRKDPAWLPPGGEFEAGRLQSCSERFRNDCGPLKNWHGLKRGLEDLAAHPSVDMLSDYISAYSSFCLFTHPSYLSAKEYSPDPKQTGNASWAPTYRKTLELTNMSTAYLLRVIECYVDTLGMVSAEIDNVITEIRTNMYAKAKYAGFETIVSVEGGAWGTLPAELQADLKSSKHPE